MPATFVPGALAVVLALACATATRSKAGDTGSATRSGLPYTPADVAFMSGMIPHHAQALVMAGWAPTHGASPAVLTLSERIHVGQQDEIALAQRWLRERGEPVPDADPPHHPPIAGKDDAFAESHHPVLMPGMLTPAELTQLDRARGSEFDRLFLTFMIRHHQGAVTMVEQLFGARGAAQDETVFRFAADVQADQLAEIDRMNRMLADLPEEGRR